jgi:hypothetical protein
VAVDGKPITTTEEILDLYAALERGGTFRIEVDREDAPTDLHFEIR